LSIEEIEAYMIEKLKIQSMYAVVEKTPEGEGPLEEEEVYRRAVNNTTSQLQGFSLNNGNPNNMASQGLRVVNNPAIKYVACTGGEIKFPANSITDSETADFITRLEKGVLSCLGVPHALLFSPDDVSGKMNSSVVDIFNGAINKRQQLLDGHGKFVIGWAVAKAVQNGDLPPNDEEILTDCFDFTHPEKFSVDDSKERACDLNDYEAGITSLSSIANKRNTTSTQIFSEIEKDQVMFWTVVNNVAKQTGTDPMMVAQGIKDSLKQKSAPFGGGNGGESSNA
jgi:hypothetical protein